MNYIRILISILFLGGFIAIIGYELNYINNLLRKKHRGITTKDILLYMLIGIIVTVMIFIMIAIIALLDWPFIISYKNS